MIPLPHAMHILVEEGALIEVVFPHPGFSRQLLVDEPVRSFRHRYAPCRHVTDLDLRLWVFADGRCRVIEHLSGEELIETPNAYLALEILREAAQRIEAAREALDNWP